MKESKFVKVVYLFLTYISIVISYEKSYEDYSVIRVVPENEIQTRFLHNWAQNLTYSQLSEINFWQFPSQVHHSVDIMVSPKIKENIIQLLKSNNMNPDIIIQNVENRIRQETFYSQLIQRQIQINWPNWGNWPNTWVGNRPTAHNNTASSSAVSDFTNNYESLDKIYQNMEKWKQKDPNNIFTQSIGTSTEGREMRIIKIGASSTKPIVWIDSGTHSREWLGITTALYMAYKLAEAQEKCFVKVADDCPQDVKELLELYDWHILPVLNPDGYMYSIERDRLWRKTRSKQRSSAWGQQCSGVDPNRNYAVGFGGSGTSSDPCSDQFRGVTAFSEPETRQQAEYLRTLKSNGDTRVKYFLSLHTYSQLILLPWSHTQTVPPEYSDLERVAQIGYNALYAIENTQYQIGSPARILYAASGSASDFAFSKSGIGIKYSYTFELRDKGQYGFIMPQSQIIPTGKETFAAVKAMTKHISNEVNTG